jgi:hypothetical protein
MKLHSQGKENTKSKCKMKKESKYKDLGENEDRN